ncbi:MAG: hypothetical protein NZM28_09005 [Fimbriimonadales bacterium]|nr:hypothetical protein [Fimbriimonadales bacterium]
MSVSEARAGAVYIPLGELERRTHELPPPHKEILLLCDSLEAYYALGWLHARGRRARLVPVESLTVADRDADATGVRYRLWEPNEWLEEIIVKGNI